MQSELKHLEGLPAYLMMQMEARLSVRVRMAITEAWNECDDYQEMAQGIHWRSLWEMNSDVYATQILHRLMEKRINDGRQFDSILAASTKAFGHMLINQVLRQE